MLTKRGVSSTVLELTRSRRQHLEHQHREEHAEHECKTNSDPVAHTIEVLMYRRWLNPDQR